MVDWCAAPFERSTFPPSPPSSKNGPVKAKRQGGYRQSLSNASKRSAAEKKLPIFLADFHLKGARFYSRPCLPTLRNPGIFPREPRHCTEANKGSSAPISFCYAKDVFYLVREPVLKKFRERKAFYEKTGFVMEIIALAPYGRGTLRIRDGTP